MKNQFFSMVRKALRKICRSVGKEGTLFRVNSVKPKVLAGFVCLTKEVEGVIGKIEVDVSELIQRFAFAKEKNLGESLEEEEKVVIRDVLKELEESNSGYVLKKRIKKREMGSPQTDKSYKEKEECLINKNDLELVTEEKTVKTENSDLKSAVEKLQNFLNNDKEGLFKNDGLVDFFGNLGELSLGVRDMLILHSKNRISLDDGSLIGLRNTINRSVGSVLLDMKSPTTTKLSNSLLLNSRNNGTNNINNPNNKNNKNKQHINNNINTINFDSIHKPKINANNNNFFHFLKPGFIPQRPSFQPNQQTHQIIKPVVEKICQKNYDAFFEQNFNGKNPVNAEKAKLRDSFVGEMIVEKLGLGESCISDVQYRSPHCSLKASRLVKSTCFGLSKGIGCGKELKNCKEAERKD